LVQRALFRNMRRARAYHDRKRLAALFWGGLTAFFCTAGELIPHVAVLAALGHVATTCYIYFLYQSIIARRLIDLVELLGKAAVLAALTLMLASVYALLVLWVGSDQSGLWLFNTLVASFVILILYDQVRPWIETTTARLIFRERYEMRQVVRRLLHVLRTTIGTDDMHNHVLETLHRSGRAVQVAMYLAHDHDSSFHLVGFRGIAPPDVLSAAQQPSLLHELRGQRRPVLLEHLVHRYEELPTLLTRSDPTLQRELERTDEAIATLRSLHASLVVPMLVGRRIVGVLTLGTEHLSEAYNTDELASLLSLAEACAVVIENSHEYEKRRERDRLVAVGEMAAGMAHEIRNPLGAIKGAAQCLDPATLPEDARELVEVIVEETDRLNGVVSQFLEYTRPLRGSPIPISVNEVAAKTLRLMERESIPPGVALVHKLDQGLPRVSADPEHLRQVIINLLLNAVHAVASRADGGHIIVSTSAIEAPSASAFDDGRTTPPARQVLLRITDDGEGIDSSDLERIFVPFFTTKPHGTGLGLAICQRIVESAGGRLEATSVVGLGATFTLRLPALNESS
jgi:two-component system sensor histidine kinase HydH